MAPPFSTSSTPDVFTFALAGQGADPSHALTLLFVGMALTAACGGPVLPVLAFLKNKTALLPSPASTFVVMGVLTTGAGLALAAGALAFAWTLHQAGLAASPGALTIARAADGSAAVARTDAAGAVLWEGRFARADELAVTIRDRSGRYGAVTEVYLTRNGAPVGPDRGARIAVVARPSDADRAPLEAGRDAFVAWVGAP